MTEAPFVQRLRGYDVFQAGHRIRRLLPSPRLSMVGPFVLFDHFGPVTLAPGEGVDIDLTWRTETDPQWPHTAVVEALPESEADDQ